MVERDEPVDVLATADEVFLASTTRDVQPADGGAGRGEQHQHGGAVDPSGPTLRHRR